MWKKFTAIAFANRIEKAGCTAPDTIADKQPTRMKYHSGLFSPNNLFILGLGFFSPYINKFKF